jgi:purine nucleoside phosphorylase
LGAPSDQILFAQLDGLPIRFLPRHGRGHKVPPSAIDFRANIDALKRAGVTDLVSVSACGSLKEELPPGISCWSTSSSTAPSRARRASSVPAASPTCRWLTR